MNKEGSGRRRPDRDHRAVRVLDVVGVRAERRGGRERAGDGVQQYGSEEVAAREGEGRPRRGSPHRGAERRQRAAVYWRVREGVEPGEADRAM